MTPYNGKTGYWLKRGFDLVVVVLLSPMVLLAAVFLAISVRIWLGTPVVFRQDRIGLNNRPFTLYKFRSMTQQQNASGELLPDNQRLTRFGRLLRSLSLDEVPQLWNVVKGELSLVGPRPLLTDYLSRYSPHQRRRHDVLPGITGWAQVNGRNALTWAERFELDVWYVDNWSMWLDLKIIWKTFFTVLRRDGIDSSSGQIMEPFDGTN